MVYMVETFLLLPTSVQIYESRDNICQVIEVSVSPVTHKPLNCNDKTALVDSLFETEFNKQSNRRLFSVLE